MHAAAVHGLAVSCEAIDHARIALKRLGLIGKGKERDRRPTREEISRLLTYLNGNPRQTIPVGRIMLFAIATGLRLDEISRMQWEDVNETQRTILIRDRKHPRDKRTNNPTIALGQILASIPLL
jgi:integrase